MASTTTPAAAAAQQPLWRCLCLPELEGRVTVRPLPSDNAASAAGTASENDEEVVARVLALVREGVGGVVGEWVEPPEEESSGSDSGSSDDEEEAEGDEDGGSSSSSGDDDGREHGKPLPRLALRVGGGGGGGAEGAAAESPPLLALLETVGWSDACALTHALALKSLVRGGRAVIC